MQNILKRIFGALGCFVVASKFFFLSSAEHISTKLLVRTNVTEIPLSIYSVHIVPSVCETKLYTLSRIPAFSSCEELT